MSMTELEEKIRCVLGRWFSGSDGYSLSWLDDLATSISSAISEEKEPDLPITPGEWHSISCRRRDVEGRICTVTADGGATLIAEVLHEPNAQAIAACQSC